MGKIEKNAGLFYMVVAVFFAAIISPAHAALSPDSAARILGGFPPQENTSEVNAIISNGVWAQSESFARHWGHEEQFSNGTSNIFSQSNQQFLNNFFAQNLGAAREDTHNLIYFFGGPDVLFPNLLFPNLERTVLVGLENPGHLPDPSSMSAWQLQSEMSDISTAYLTILKMSYFITNQMSRQLQDFGTTTMICIGLVANGYTISSVDQISLGAQGEVLENPGMGVRIRYQKTNGRIGEVFYFQKDLSNGSMQAVPNFIAFIQNNRFETAYYKAASYVAHNISDFSIVNDLVLSKVSHIVQNDDGLPMQALTSQASHWNIKLFGLYTAPDHQFGVGAQPLLRDLYGAKICRVAGGRDREIWQSLWPNNCASPDNNFGFQSVTWAGTLPFHYGYAGFSGPGTYGGNPLPAGLSMGWQEMVKWSNLQVVDRQ